MDSLKLICLRGLRLIKSNTMVINDIDVQANQKSNGTLHKTFGWFVSQHYKNKNYVHQWTKTMYLVIIGHAAD